MNTNTPLLKNGGRSATANTLKKSDDNENDLDLTAAPAMKGQEGNDDDNLLGKKRKRTVRATFNPQALISGRGMWHLYDKMLKRPTAAASLVPGQKTSRNPVTEDLKQVMDVYRMWARQLNPGKNALDTMEKCGEWGGKNVVKDVLSRMRLELEIPRAIDSLAPRLEKYMESTELARLRAEDQAKSRRDGVKRNMPTFGGVEGGVDDDKEDEEDEDDKPDTEEEDGDFVIEKKKKGADEE